MTAALIAGIVLAGFLLRGCPSPSMPPRELTSAEHAEIAEVVRRETSSPVRSMTPQPDGTVQVYAGGDGELGGWIFQIRNIDGDWRVLRSTLLF
jgi:hypothetical protein